MEFQTEKTFSQRNDESNCVSQTQSVKGERRKKKGKYGTEESNCEKNGH